MKKIINLTFILIFFGITCEKNDCKIDKEFAYFFNQSLKTVEINQKNTKISIAPFSLEEAIRFLEIMTQLPSNISKNSFGIFYLKKEDYNEDMKKWKNWYENIKCEFSTQDANSIYSKYWFKKNQLDIPDSLKMKYYPKDWQELLTH